jgi:glutathione S-transferase
MGYLSGALSPGRLPRCLAIPLGERFSAADVLWGSSLAWATMFKLVPELPEVMAYIDRVSSRPAMRRAAEADALLAAAQG